MRFIQYDWDEENVFHILSRHSISPEEVEETCYNNPLVLRGRQGTYYALGQTDAGRYLIVVLRYKGKGRVRVITAREMTQTERKRFLRR